MPNGEKPRQEDQEQEQPEQKPTPEEVSKAASDLGIQPGATEKETQAVYSKAVEKYHSDVNTVQSREEFQKVVSAFEMLERAVRTGAWEQPEQKPTPEAAAEELPERFWKDMDAVAEQGERISKAIRERAEDKNFRRFVKNKYIWGAVVSLVLIGTGIGLLSRRERVSGVKSQSGVAAKSAPEELGSEELGSEELVPEEAEEKKEEKKEAAPKEAEESKKFEFEKEDAWSKPPDKAPAEERAMPQSQEWEILEAFHFFVKDSTAEKIEGNSFAVDIGGRDYHCYKVTPEVLAVVKAVQEDYETKVKTFISDKKQKPFASGQLRQGLRERAEREVKRIIRTYCEKIDEVAPELVPDKIKEAQQKRQEIKEKENARVKAQIEKGRAKRQV